MPIIRDGRIYYRTPEACQEAGISRATLFRWMSEGAIPDAGLRGQNGWRLFSAEEITTIRARATSPVKKPTPGRKGGRRERKEH